MSDSAMPEGAASMSRCTALLAAAGAIPLWAAAMAQPAAAPADRSSNGPPVAAPLTAKLTGAAQVPPADEDGSGAFEATLNDTHDELCYALKVDNIAEASAAAIHEGAAGHKGRTIIVLRAPANGVANGCATVTAELAIKLTQHPERYYVSVTNAAYPTGAVRGQLEQ